MDVIVYCPDEPRHRQITRYDLDKLLGADDGLREDEAEIRATLARGDIYRGGGGAAPAFEIRPLIQIGDRITFRPAACRWYTGRVTRVVNGFLREMPTVRFGGWLDFIVKPAEIEAIERRAQSEREV